MLQYEVKPTGRLTWEELGEHIAKMSKEQQSTDVTIEIPWDDECYAGELRIADITHYSLDDWHPVINVLKE